MPAEGIIERKAREACLVVTGDDAKAEITPVEIAAIIRLVIEVYECIRKVPLRAISEVREPGPLQRLRLQWVASRVVGLRRSGAAARIALGLGRELDYDDMVAMGRQWEAESGS